MRGRGGAGFSAGMKWSLTMKGRGIPRGYLVCNADEMEPGTFKDRLLLEQLPHLLIEGMIIGGYANHSRFGYIFLRGEYVEAARALTRALDEARAAGWLGNNIAGSGYDFDIALHTGAGRYICGEETALISSLEGNRANPRAKPPFPGQSGAWGKPTVVNNVETFCNAPAVMRHGAKWYQELSGGLQQRRRHQALRRLRQGQSTGSVGIADRHHAATNCSSVPVACATAGRSRPGCPAAAVPVFCCPSILMWRSISTPSAIWAAAWAPGF